MQLELFGNHVDDYINFGFLSKNAYGSNEHAGNARVKELFLERRDEYLSVGSEPNQKSEWTKQFLEDEEIELYIYNSDNGPEVSLVDNEKEKVDYFLKRFQKWK